jgi:hypothetical protein
MINPSPVRRVPSPNRYMAVARFCFCKNNKRTIDRFPCRDFAAGIAETPIAETDMVNLVEGRRRRRGEADTAGGAKHKKKPRSVCSHL